MQKIFRVGTTERLVGSATLQPRHGRLGSPLSSWSQNAGLIGMAVAPFVGSFLGTLIERLPKGSPVVVGRSACPHCGTRLRAADMMPLLSWLAARGRCRYCGHRLGIFYPLIELASVAVALAAILVLGDAGAWLIGTTLVLGWVLLALSWIDHRHLVLPDVLTLPLIPGGLLVAWMVSPESLPHHVLGAALGYAALIAVAALYHRARGRAGLGAGDAKLFAAAGAWLSWEALPSVLLIGGILGLVLALAGSTGRRLAADTAVPFGPALAGAFWLVWLLGPVHFA